MTTAYINNRPMLRGDEDTLWLWIIRARQESNVTKMERSDDEINDKVAKAKAYAKRGPSAGILLDTTL